MSQNQYSGSQSGNYLQPPGYDPRRLFPFGLSPIPEVPSELASEVSSIASYSPTPSLDDSDTEEIESVRSRGSIMYSGSCDSIKSNVTLHGKSSDESSTETDSDEEEEEEDDDEEEEAYAIASIPPDTPVKEILADVPSPSKSVSPKNISADDLIYTEQIHVNQVSQQCYSDTVERMQYSEEQEGVGGVGTEDGAGTEATSDQPTFPYDMVSGAATASEIFRHLQATRGKQEVTTELAKILTVLKTTLNSDDKDSSSSDEESSSGNSYSKNSNPMPTGKPPKPPQKLKFSKNSVISPAIQARIRELEANKPDNPKEEMNLLSKILVHLLCSCKTAAAAHELKRIIRQFKEVAKVAMEEGDDLLESLRSSSRASSRNSKRKIRSRTASGNSNISGNSETDSMNTLTPGDSKSSGTDDEKEGQDANLGKIRFTSNLNCDDKFTESNTCVSYTLTIPLKKAYEEVDEKEDNGEEDDEEWEWEYEEESSESPMSPRHQNDSSGSSRNQTPSDTSTGSTRKILLEMEMGAYNSGSASHSDQGNSQSTPITEEEDALLDDDDGELKLDKKNKKLTEKVEASGNLFCHLEETFKVLSDTYNIITTGNSPEVMSNYSPTTPDKNITDKSFEDILDGVSNQCVQLESEIMRSSRQSTVEPDGCKSAANSRPASRNNSRNDHRVVSRPASRQKVKTPAPEVNEAEEDWGDEDEWEYYYEEDYPEEGAGQSQPSRPASIIKIIQSRPVSRQNKKDSASPVMQNTVNPKSPSPKPSTRPPSRVIATIVSRPSSRAASSMKNEAEAKSNDDDWGDEDEWEYYYEEDYQEEEKKTESTGNKSRPVSRAKVASAAPSRAPSRTQSRQSEVERTIYRASSRQELIQIVAENCIEIKNGSRPPSRIVSRPASRAKSVQQTANDNEEEWGDEDEWEYYYEEDYPEETNCTATNTAKETVKPEIHTASSTILKPVILSRPSSRSGSSQSIANNNNNGANKIVISRPNSRQSLVSRPSSRSDSRAESRAASRIRRNTSGLGNVAEEDEYEWYYDDGDDAELGRISPSLTTAPTTRATSPFPDEKGRVDVNTGTGFSKRKLTLIKETEETSPVSRTPTNRDTAGSVTPRCSSVSGQGNDATSRTPTFYPTGYLNPMAGVSLALAAEYLGQDAMELAASLPAKFIEENQVLMKEKKKKHKHKHRSEDKEDDEERGEEKEKRKKKKGDGKFLPKVGVRELASRLEPQLFQDMQVGNRMIISKEEVRDVIRETRKKSVSKDSYRDTVKSATPTNGQSSKSKEEEKRKSVREMVQLMSNQNSQIIPNQNHEDINYTEAVCTVQSFSIPSISVSSNMCPPPVPPPPQSYYPSQSPQFPPNQYQHYPIEVHPQYPQYAQSPHSPYQQYPPQSPYQQYPQQYHGYQGYPPPPPHQHYQQYPQQYPAYQQLQPYHPGYQNYPPPPPPPQQMVYHSESNPNQMKVVSGGMTTVVNMRPKSSSAKPKDTGSKTKSPTRNSPEGSEAYGTGSTGSDQTEGQAGGIDHEEGGEGEDGTAKPHKRHSRLFKLLQESDYTDSDTESRSEYSRISMKNVEDNHGRESDIDSVCSGLERTGIERKHSFRSHKSSNKESDNESVTSSGVERKISPNSVQNNIKHRRFMQLNLQSNYEPSSSELSTPNSPTGPGPQDRKSRSGSKPPSRVWNYHADDFDSHAGVSDDSSYQSLQSLNSFDSIYDNVAGREVEEIMKRKVSRDNLYRYQTDSPGAYVRASPKGVDLLRGSPKTHSSSPKLENYNRASPKLEQELLELTNFPSSPGLTLRQLQSHRNFYGTK